jgi:hypothetical protein
MLQNVKKVLANTEPSHMASVIAVQRHVRSWVKTGSNRHRAKVSRLMWWTTPAPASNVPKG